MRCHHWRSPRTRGMADAPWRWTKMPSVRTVERDRSWKRIGLAYQGMPVNGCRSGSSSVGINAGRLDDELPLRDLRLQMFVQCRWRRPLKADRLDAELGEPLDHLGILQGRLERDRQLFDHIGGA